LGFCVAELLNFAKVGSRWESDRFSRLPIRNLDPADPQFSGKQTKLREKIKALGTAIS
jgi:hypothetical protein